MSLRNSHKGPPKCVVGAPANLFSIKCGPKRLGPAGFLNESETWEKGQHLALPLQRPQLHSDWRLGSHECAAPHSGPTAILGRLCELHKGEITSNCCWGISGIQGLLLFLSLTLLSPIPRITQLSAVQLNLKRWRKGAHLSTGVGSQTCHPAGNQPCEKVFQDCREGAELKSQRGGACHPPSSNLGCSLGSHITCLACFLHLKW